MKNSKLVGCLLDVFMMCKDRVISYSRTSIAINLIKKIYLSPVQTVSIILIIAILPNIFYNILFNEDIGLWGWALRILLYIVGWGCLFCRAGWEDIKKTSLVLRFVDRQLLN
ncbi:hypothetical protein ACFL1K_00285 [Candidatus Omnitrophota bacterium]